MARDHRGGQGRRHGRSGAEASSRASTGQRRDGLERDWAEFTGSKHVLSFNSGTAALHSALFAAGVGPGDEVITSAFSFSGSFHPILQQNAIPIFVDIDPRTYNIDVGQIEDKLSDRTKVLMPVHIHGLPADMDAIMALAEKHDLLVIEDACQAHGATYNGQNGRHPSSHGLLQPERDQEPVRW